MTTDIYFYLKDNDNDVNTNKTINRDYISAKYILTTFLAPNVFTRN